MSLIYFGMPTQVDGRVCVAGRWVVVENTVTPFQLPFRTTFRE